MVPHQGLITVYPKDGSAPRQASFVQSFNEDDLRSENIRYFFPDGCQSPQLELDTAALTKSFFPEKTAKASVSPALSPATGSSDKSVPSAPPSAALYAQPTGSLPPASAIAEIPVEIEDDINKGSNRQGRLKSFGADLDAGKTLPLAGSRGSDLGRGTEQLNNGPPQKPFAGQKYLTPSEPGFSGIDERFGKSIIQAVSPGTKPAVVSGKSTTSGANLPSEGVTVSSASVDLPKTPKVEVPKAPLSPLPVPHPPVTAPFKQPNNKCSDTCCDDNRPQILMSRAAANSCCKGVAKIVIPIEMDELGKIPMPELLEITNETNNIEMLQKLLKLVEKYNL